MKRLPKNPYPNKWKYFSHVQRKLHLPVTLESFKAFQERSLTPPDVLVHKRDYLFDSEYILSKDNPSNRSIFTRSSYPANPSIESKCRGWSQFPSIRPLSDEYQEILNNEMREFVKDNPPEIQLNKMVQIQFERERLAEMLRIETFRYEFLRSNLAERNKTKCYVDLPVYRERKQLIGKIQDKIEKKIEKRLETRKKGSDLLNRVESYLGSKILEAK